MISAVFASTITGGIGNNGTLPWPKNSQDLVRFKELTENHIVIMGRKTWNDPCMPKPLPNRINYVVTSSPIPNYSVKTISTNRDILEQILTIRDVYPQRNIFIIGGLQLLESCKPIIEQVFLTRIFSNWRSNVKINLENFLEPFQLKTVKPFPDCTFERWGKPFVKKAIQ